MYIHLLRTFFFSFSLSISFLFGSFSRDDNSIVHFMRRSLSLADTFHSGFQRVHFSLSAAYFHIGISSWLLFCSFFVCIATGIRCAIIITFKQHKVFFSKAKSLFFSFLNTLYHFAI